MYYAMCELGKQSQPGVHVMWMLTATDVFVASEDAGAPWLGCRWKKCRGSGQSACRSWNCDPCFPPQRYHWWRLWITHDALYFLLLTCYMFFSKVCRFLPWLAYCHVIIHDKLSLVAHFAINSWSCSLRSIEQPFEGHIWDWWSWGSIWLPLKSSSYINNIKNSQEVYIFIPLHIWYMITKLSLWIFKRLKTCLPVTIDMGTILRSLKLICRNRKGNNVSHCTQPIKRPAVWKIH